MNILDIKKKDYETLSKFIHFIDSPLLLEKIIIIKHDQEYITKIPAILFDFINNKVDKLIKFVNPEQSQHIDSLSLIKVLRAILLNNEEIKLIFLKMFKRMNQSSQFICFESLKNHGRKHLLEMKILPC